MADRKPHPGLDEVVSDEALDRFAAGASFTDAPTRTWPTVVLVGALAATIGVALGYLVAPYVTGLQMTLAVSVAIGGAAAFYTTEFDS